jgi:hypothetical protein
LRRPDGALVAGDERLTVVTSDFLAEGGDALFTGARASSTGTLPAYEVLAKALQARGAAISARQFFDRRQPRISREADRCPGSPAGSP